MEGIGTRRGKRRAAAVLLLLFLVIATKAPALECPISVNNTNYLNHPDISGDRIVWEGAGDIYLFNFADGNGTRLTSDAIAQSSPFISSSLVTWNEGDSILLQDLSTSDPPITLTTSPTSPALSGRWVAWLNTTDPLGITITIYDTTRATPTEILTEPFDRVQPAISGDRLIWVNGTGLTTIYLKTLPGGIVELVNETLCSDPLGLGSCISSPAISGDRVVWPGSLDSGNWDIFFRNLSDPSDPNGFPLTRDTEFFLNPVIDGDLVAWTNGADIFLDNVSDTSSYEILSSGGNSGPRLSGNRVVYYKNLGTKQDIYLSTVGSSQPCPVADFTANVTSGLTPLPVQFSDTSGDPNTTHWHWEFGDGTTSFEQNPVHVYSSDDSYNVSLTVASDVGRAYTSIASYIHVGSLPYASFTADRTYGIVPLTVRFTDTSSGNPDTWVWDLNGDGLSESSLQNPTYTYSIPGVYNVNFSANNTFGPPGTVNMTGYIRALNGTSLTSNTVIAGLDVTTVGGMQQITVDTGRIGSTFNPAENSSWLILSPPVSSGWERMDLFSMDGIGFQESGGLIQGTVTSCILESRDLPPATFATGIGNNLPVSYRLYLSAYPVNAGIDATIWEGAIPADGAAFGKTIAETSRNFTSVLGTAYTLDFVTRNLTGVRDVTLNLSVSAAWIQQYGNQNNIAVLRLGDDLVNQTLIPSATFTDPAANLDFFTVPSPRGLSRFGLVSAAGSSNLIQIGARVATQVIQSSSSGGGSSAPPLKPSQPQAPFERQPAIYYGVGEIGTNPAGITREPVIIKSEDWVVSLAIDAGIEAFDGTHHPLISVAASPVGIESIPPLPEGTGFRFTGIAYDIRPDGATFNPPATISFTVPEGQWTGDNRYSIRYYVIGTGSWEEIPTTVDPASHVVSGRVSHLCLFALFAVPAAEVPTTLPVTGAPVVTLEVQPKPVPRTPMGTFTGMMGWLYETATSRTPVSLTVLLGVLAAVYTYTRRAWLSRHRTWITLYLISCTGLLWALFLFARGGLLREPVFLFTTIAGLNLIVHIFRFDRVNLSSRARRGYVEIGRRR